MENLWFGGGAVGAGSESKPKQKQTHPKQNRFKPGRWVGLDPFAPGHNKTIKNGHLVIRMFGPKQRKNCFILVW